MDREKETDGQQAAAQGAAADNADTQRQDQAEEGKTPADFIARAEAELAKKDQDAARTPAAEKAERGGAGTSETAEQKARRAGLEKMISGWPEEDRKLFASASENLRELLGRHYRNFQSDYTKKTQQAAALRAAVERDMRALRPVIAGKYRDIRHFASYVSDMQNFERELRRDPLRTLSILARHAGVDLAQLQGYRPDPAAEAVRPLQAQIAQMQQMLQAKTQPAPPPEEQTREPAPQDALPDAVTAFAEAEDENGQKLHPHFNELAPMMGYIMRRDGHEDLEKAYKEALYSLPKVREELLEKERQQAAQKQAEVDRAKRAAALQARAGAGGGADIGNRKKKIEDIIAQAEEELAGQ